MTTLSQLKKVSTLSQLKALNIGSVTYDVGGRGGYCGFYNGPLAQHFNVPTHHLPEKFGAFCNYLGGGMRGAICTSTFNVKVTSGKAKLLTELAEACKRVYINLEGDMNNEEDESGETNWEAKATNAARAAGVKSAY